MEQVLNVSYPRQLAFSLKMHDNEFVQEMKKLTIIKLYEIGKISSSVAANILNLTRVDFIEVLNKYQVSVFSFDTENELLSDIKNA
jgi:predicted HTH domain antitoxin